MRSRPMFLTLILASLFGAGLVNAEPRGSHTWISPVAGWIQMSRHIRYPDDSLADHWCLRVAEVTRTHCLLPGLTTAVTGSGEISGIKYMKAEAGLPDFSPLL